MGAMPTGPYDNKPVPKGVTDVVAIFRHFFGGRKNVKPQPDIVPVGLSRRAQLGNRTNVQRHQNVPTAKAGRRG